MYAIKLFDSNNELFFVIAVSKSMTGSQLVLSIEMLYGDTLTCNSMLFEPQFDVILSSLYDFCSISYAYEADIAALLNAFMNASIVNCKSVFA